MLYLTEASFDMFMAQAHKNMHHTQSHDICSYPFRDEITADDQIILCNTSISRENREKPACVKEKGGKCLCNNTRHSADLFISWLLYLYHELKLCNK